MNSLEAIIAATTLLLSFGILLGTINAENKEIYEMENGINAKITALNCATIIDAIASNNAEEYGKKIECKTEKNTIKATTEGKTKQAQTIVETEKDYGMQIKKTEHYLGEK
jgi:hypothetical protein